MTIAPDTRSLPPATATLEGVRHGALITLPILPSVFFFGAAFGALAAQKGMTLSEAILFSGLTFAGASQFAAMEAWRETWSLAGFLAIGAIVGVVNLRLLLMSAALRPWLHGLPPSFVYPQFFLLTDVNYIIASRYRMQGGADAGVLIGSGLIQWALWAFSVIPGYIVASLTSDPERYGIDLIMPILFAAMSASLWKSHRDTRNWAIAGAAALAVMYAVPGQWHIIAGALAGMLSAAFLDGGEHT